MKRDMDLAREILRWIEQQEIPKLPILKIDGYSDEVISYHVMLLHEAGLIEAMNASARVQEWRPKRLTWNGHEFLDASRNDTLWNKAKELTLSATGGVSFDVLKTLLVDLAKKAIGL